MELKQIKTEMLKKVKRMDEYEVMIKIYEYEEDGPKEYIIEFWIEGEEWEAWDEKTFYDEAEAKKRAKQNLRTLTNWFKDKEGAKIKKEIELYHV